MTDKYHEQVAKSGVTTDDAFVSAEVKRIIEKNLEANRTPEVLKLLFNCIDLTTLNATDSPSSVARVTERVNAFEAQHPELPPVAAICVFPCFSPVVRTVLDVSEVNIACVSGGFPTSQTFPEVKIAETALAVESGADVIQLAMARVWKRLRDEKMESRLILTVHDELIVEAPEAEAEKAAQSLREEMEGCVHYAVPLSTDVHTGKYWLEAH